MKKITTSKSFSLTKNETLNGLLYAILIPALVTIQQSLDAEVWVFNWKQIAMTSLASGGLYLLRKFLNAPKVTITTRTNKEAETIKNNLK